MGSGLVPENARSFVVGAQNLPCLQRLIFLCLNQSIGASINQKRSQSQKMCPTESHFEHEHEMEWHIFLINPLFGHPTHMGPYTEKKGKLNELGPFINIMNQIRTDFSKTKRKANFRLLMVLTCTPSSLWIGISLSQILSPFSRALFIDSFLVELLRTFQSRYFITFGPFQIPF